MLCGVGLFVLVLITVVISEQCVLTSESDERVLFRLVLGLTPTPPRAKNVNSELCSVLASALLTRS